VSAEIATAAAEAAPFSPAAELREAYRRMKERRIRVSVARSTRAGSVGNPCLRYIYYERTIPAAERVPHDVGRQELFDLGNALEPWIVREIEESGFEIASRQRDWYDPELELGARADVRIRGRGWPRPVVTEIKGMQPAAAERIRTWQDIRDHASPYVRRYYDQLHVYLHPRFDDGEVGLFALANKGSGHVEFIDCPRDPQRIAEIEEKARRVRDAVRAKEPPPRYETDACARCPFLAVCMPSRSFGAGVQVLDEARAAEASALIVRRLELAGPAGEFKKVDEALKALLPEVEGELLAGDFVVVGKRRERAGFVAKPTSWIERRYVPLAKDSTH
jgi:hypothetical protein